LTISAGTTSAGYRHGRGSSFRNPTQPIISSTQPIDDKYSVAYHHKCNFTKYLNPQLLAPPNVEPN